MQGLDRMRTNAGALVVLLALSWARPAPADVATAETLFREGRRLMAAGQLTEACTKLAESERLDPSSGTLINLAACHAELGRTATAWAEFLAAERLALAQQRPLRAEEAKARAAELEPQVPYLTVRVAASVPGLVLTRDGETLGEAAFGMALPVDPGSHVMTATAPGRKDWTETFDISEPGEHRVVDVPELEVMSTPAPAAERPEPEHPHAVPARSLPVPAVASQPGREPRSTRSATAALPLGFWVASGASVAATAVGSIFGGLSLSNYGRADENCPSHRGCDDRAMTSRERAETQANIANAALGTAVAAALVAGWLYFTADDAGRAGTDIARRAAIR
jgi:hypothetical protein